MKTVVLGQWPPEMKQLIERRRALGQDLFDEMWEGEYHLAPAPHPSHGIVDHRVAVALDPYIEAAGLIGTGPFNLGSPDDYRVPDRGVHRTAPAATWVATAALVVEIVSPDDETWQKLDFYAAHHVDELLVVDPVEMSATWLALDAGTYQPTQRSEVLGADIASILTSIQGR